MLRGCIQLVPLHLQDRRTQRTWLPRRAAPEWREMPRVVANVRYLQALKLPGLWRPLQRDWPESRAEDQKQRHLRSERGHQALGEGPSWGWGLVVRARSSHPIERLE